MIKLILSPSDTTLSSLKAFLALVKSSELTNTEISIQAPMLLYSVAHFRTCAEELDRVYGIIQVYGLRLGASKQSERPFNLDELEEPTSSRPKVSPTSSCVNS